jgi:translocation and assembly module TamA
VYIFLRCCFIPRLSTQIVSIFAAGVFSLTAFSSTHVEDETPADSRLRPVQVLVQGTDQELVDAVSILTQGNQLQCDSPGWKIKEVLDTQVKTVRITLRAYGYYNAAIEREVVRKQDCWSITLTLEPGTRTTIKTIDLKILGTARFDEDFLRSIENSQLQIGEALSHDRYEQTKKRIQRVASKMGYFDGQFVQNKLKVDQTNNSADIVLHYQSGDRYRIGELLIDQDALDEEFFYKFIPIRSGDLFDDSILTTTYQGLSASGYFSSIEVAASLEQRRDGVIPVVIKANKGKSKSYSFGVGVSTDTGPRIKFSHSNNLSNSSGHSHRTELSLSPVLSNLGFSYRIPDQDPKSDYFEISAHGIYENTDTVQSDTFNLGVARTNLLDSGWLRVTSLQYSIDDFEVSETREKTNLLRPSLGFSKTVSDSPLRPLRGYRLNAEITGASSSLLSDISFIQGSLNTKFVRGMSEKSRILGRMDFGYTGVDEFHRLPTNLRFFAGGDNSIRGYGYKTLGPKDEFGNVVGGKGQLVGSIEIDYLIKPKWSIAGFVDAGNAFDDSDFDVKVGAGFGVRWQSPIGPLGIDLGFPVDDPDSDDSVRLHIRMGPDL